MNKQNIVKNIVIVIVVLTVIFFAYKFLVSGEEDKGIDVIVSPKTEVVSVRDIELLRKKLDGIKVDTKIFSEESFGSLEDYRTQIFEEPVGRDNPFFRI